ncbi:chromate efflux transporter [Yoonia sp. R2331]|uniref:chromate efflux transporter n=1 Tax=Yoonia sp. R2331 TaxID=3237238 RepID=UPI0034E50D3F
MTPDWHQMLRVFGRIGLLSFGGPAAQIAVMHRELVEERDWLTEDQFLRALTFCMLLPGPEAMQLATYAGWRQRGIAGGLLAGGLFVIPGAIVITALALIYGAYGSLPLVQAIFVGVQATVVVIVLGAMHKLIGKALHGPMAIALAALSFLALFALSLPFPLVIAAAALVGATLLRRTPAPTTEPPRWHGLGRIMMIGGAIWAAPLALSFAAGQTFLLDIGIYFSKLAVVTFGGAYAVLAYMAQTVVQDYGWITTTQMMDGLGLAETTPGPLILVTQMVAMLAGLTAQGTGMALLAGGMALWVTFVPCFIWIFAGAPLIDWLAGQPRLQAALAGITAAVVGVIANLSLWFAVHVFFGVVIPFTSGPITLTLPVLDSLQAVPLALAILAGYLMWQRGWSLLFVLALNAGLGLLLFLAGIL